MSREEDFAYEELKQELAALLDQLSQRELDLVELSALRARNQELKAKLWLANDSQLRTYDGLAQKAAMAEELVAALRDLSPLIKKSTDLPDAVLAVMITPAQAARNYADKIEHQDRLIDQAREALLSWEKLK